MFLSVKRGGQYENMEVLTPYFYYTLEVPQSGVEELWSALG